MDLRVGSVASGIGGDAMAWHPLGWESVFFSEIAPFPSAVLAHRFPGVPNLGDFTAPDFCERARACGEIDVLAAGTPCQAFSVAGKRGSLKDDRGNLTLRFVEVVHELDPAIVVWENVPGVLSTEDNAFGCFLAGMVGASEPLASGLDDGRWPNAGMVVGPRRSLAWRILDAQYLGLAQRRRRVCVVSFRARDRTNPRAVLFEPESVRRDSPPSREEGQEVAGTLKARATSGGQIIAFNARQDPVHGKMTGALDVDPQSQCIVAQCHGSNVGPMGALRVGNGNETGGVPFTIYSQNGCAKKQHAEETDLSGSVDSQGNYAAGQGGTVVAFSCKDHGADAGELAPTIRAMTHDKSHTNAGRQVAVASEAARARRLTPRECERLQGFPDDYTLVPYRGRAAERCADGPRYRALGNAWAVSVFRWIGRRVEKVLEARGNCTTEDTESTEKGARRPTA